MNRRTRYLLNRLANGIETAAEALVVWLRAKAERKARPRPLCFPSPFEEMMERLTGSYVHHFAERVIRDLLGGPKMIRVTDDIPFVHRGVDLAPDDRKDAMTYSLITYGRSTPIYKDGI